MDSFFERALKSVCYQNYNKINHIIVIDGSEAAPVIEKLRDTIDDYSTLRSYT